jgi:hypothetical protein
LHNYLVSEENAIIIVTLRRINPRVANKVDSALARNIFKCDSLEVEFTVMFVSYQKCPWNSNLLIPVKGDLESRLAGG